MPLAIIVTTVLILAYATAAMIDQWYLVPHYWLRGQPYRYGILLFSVMITLTTLALVCIRLAYTHSFGPDPDPLGFPKHLAIDFVGMCVHLGIAKLYVITKSKITTESHNRPTDHSP